MVIFAVVLICAWLRLHLLFPPSQHHLCFVRDVWLAARQGCNPLALPLFVCCSIFQLNSAASFFRDFVFEWLPREGAEEMAEHITHLSSLLSYLAGGRWWYPFPPSNVFAFTPYAKCQHAASWQSFFIWSKQLGWISQCIFAFSLLLSADCCF